MKVNFVLDMYGTIWVLDENYKWQPLDNTPHEGETLEEVEIIESRSISHESTDSEGYDQAYGESIYGQSSEQFLGVGKAKESGDPMQDMSGYNLMPWLQKKWWKEKSIVWSLGFLIDEESLKPSKDPKDYPEYEVKIDSIPIYLESHYIHLDGRIDTTVTDTLWYIRERRQRKGK